MTSGRARGDGFSVLFSRLHGGLMSYRYGGEDGDAKELLTSIPKPSFWHAPTSNERGWDAPFLTGQWLLASRYARAAGDQLLTARVTREDDAVTVSYTYGRWERPDRCHPLDGRPRGTA
jgi:beta-galactosidase